MEQKVEAEEKLFPWTFKEAPMADYAQVVPAISQPLMSAVNLST